MAGKMIDGSSNAEDAELRKKIEQAIGFGDIGMHGTLQTCQVTTMDLEEIMQLILARDIAQRQAVREALGDYTQWLIDNAYNTTASSFDEEERITIGTLQMLQGEREVLAALQQLKTPKGKE